MQPQYFYGTNPENTHALCGTIPDRKSKHFSTTQMACRWKNIHKIYKYDTNPEMTTIRFAEANHVKIGTQTDSGL